MAEKKFFNKLSQGVFGKTQDGSSLEEENKRLRRAVSELSILNDLALAVGTAADPQDMVHKLVDRLMRAVGAEQATVSLFDRMVRGLGQDADPSDGELDGASRSST